MPKLNALVAGSTGYIGVQLIKLLIKHKFINIRFLCGNSSVGKNKTTFTPHMDDGDFVVVKNVEQAKFTGKKFKDKKYYRHTGHPGGIKEITPEKLLEKNKPGETLKLAIKRMLPGGVLGRKQLTRNLKLNWILKTVSMQQVEEKNLLQKFGLKRELVKFT